MNNEVPLNFLARLLSKIHHIGLLGTVRMGIWKALRPVRAKRHRAHVWRQPYRVSRGELAAALSVIPEDLSAEVRRLRGALTRRLPVSPESVAAIRTLYEQQAPGVLEATVESADRICAHVFDLLGSGPIALGATIDWHQDFKSGYRWNPDQCFLDVTHGHEVGVDIKVPWELSRGHHLVLLAQTAVLTHEAKYAQECVAQITDWINANPVGRGVNWACPMDVAIRAVNWLWALGLLAERGELRDDWTADVVASLISHGRFILDNLELRDDGITTNHYLADIVGLLYLGLCLREVSEANTWLEFSIPALQREMDRQVLPDGVHYESSVSYHRLMTEMFLSAAMLCRNHGIELSTAFKARLEKMCEFVAGYTKPNGLAPQIGDGDNGRLHMLTGYGNRDPRDHRHLLAVGAVFFDRSEWWQASGSSWIEGVWFGGDCWAKGGKAGVPPPIQSTAFSEGGVYIFRKEQDYVLLNGNSVGTRGVGTHKHNDLLSLEMHLGGEDILVDSGSFLYTSDPQSYDHFRRTQAHSTVRVDQVEQNRFLPGKLFCLHPDSRVFLTQWESGGAVESVSVEHDGYERLSAPVRHRRTVWCDWLERSWQVTDHLYNSVPRGPSSPHYLEWTLIFAPHCSLQSSENGWHVITPRQKLWMDGPYLSVNGSRVKVSSYLDAQSTAMKYGNVVEACCLRWKWEGELPVEGFFTIAST